MRARGGRRKKLIWNDAYNEEKFDDRVIETQSKKSSMIKGTKTKDERGKRFKCRQKIRSGRRQVIEE